MSKTESTKNPSSVYRLGIAVVVVAVMLAIFMVISPQMKARTDAQASAAAAKSTQDRLSVKFAQLKSQATDSTESVNRLNALTGAFPNTFAQSQFLNLLRRASRGAGVTVMSVTSTQPADPSKFDEKGAVVAPAPATPTAPVVSNSSSISPQAVPKQALAETFPLAQVSVTITVNGNSRGIARFLKSVSTLDRPVLVDSVTIGNIGALNGSSTIVGRTYLSRPLVVPSFGNK